MIEFLDGICVHKSAFGLVINVNGVGYGVEAPVSTLCELPAVGERCSLWIETYVREDALKLYGFLDRDDRTAFQLIRTAQGVGPKLALSILSHFSAQEFRQVILQERIELLLNVPGIGKTTAEKIIVALKNRLQKWQPAVTENTPTQFTSSDTFEDITSALRNLGYKDLDINKATTALKNKIKELPSAENFAIFLKEALRLIGKPGKESHETI